MWTHALSPDHPFPKNSKMALLVKPSEVLTMRLMGTGLTAPIEIPEIFYADRYMENNQGIALHLQKQIFEIKRNGLQKLAAWETQRTRCQGKSGCRKYQWLESPHSIHQCNEKAIKHAQFLLDRLQKNVQWRQFEARGEGDQPYSIEDIKLASTWEGPAVYTEEEESKRRELQTMIQTLQDELEQVDKDLIGKYCERLHIRGLVVANKVVIPVCKMRKEEYYRLLAVISKRLTCQENETDDSQFVFKSDPQIYRPDYWTPKQKYLLRGVALTPELSYVCVREPDDLIQVDEDPQAGHDQWWKIQAPAQENKPAEVVVGGSRFISFSRAVSLITVATTEGRYRRGAACCEHGIAVAYARVRY